MIELGLATIFLLVANSALKAIG